jgi:pyruvate,water dikinase
MDSEMMVDGEALVLKLDSSAAEIASVGGKGASLARLARAGLPVPPGFHVTTLAYRRFVTENGLHERILSAAALAAADDPASLERASREIQGLIQQGAMSAEIAEPICTAYANLGLNQPVAVRSSATAEDLPDMSFAGQQETYLNVRGHGELLDSVKRCWASLWTARALGYRARNGVASEDVALAVVVQQLVWADAAGILFTANPLTGARDEMVINAAWGLGEAIVGGHVTPDLFVLNGRTCELVSQTIADKDTMTVRLPSGTGEQPVPSERRRLPALTPAEAAELARLGSRIERLYGQPMDIEWALMEGRPFILQARPVTVLPSARVELEWPLPHPKRRYFRTSVIELLPEPLSPLFATIALPSWNAAMREEMKQMAPRSPLPDRMQTLLTINDYAYYELGLNGWQIARLVLTIIGRIQFVLPYTLIRGEVRWRDHALPQYTEAATSWGKRDLDAMSSAALLEGLREIVRFAAKYYLTIQTGILPAAFSSEALLTMAYTTLARRKGDPSAATFLLGFDSVPIRAEKSLYDLARWVESQPALARYVTRTGSTDLATAYLSAFAPISDNETWSLFCRRFSDHLDSFGHTVYDLDFAKSLPADDPAPLLEALKYFLGNPERSPYERQRISTSARDNATEILLRRGRLRARLFSRLLPWAQRHAPLREDALAEVGVGWPVVRRLARELGRRLTDAGALASMDDVFWLNGQEAEEAARRLDEHHPVHDYRGVVSERRAAADRERTVTPPVVLPVKSGARILGIDFSRMTPARSDQAQGATIKGQGASAGRVTGVARVIHGPSDFSMMQRGDILVAKVTTPAWTPLFALASGIVTDVGGPLSHSSIVAREYRIPAVLGTGVATERIRSGQRIVVDGDSGVVSME